MIIPQHIIDVLIDQAKKDAPNESCGYLLGLPSSGEEGQGVVAKESVVTENYWMENIDHSSEHFSFAPKDQFAALRYARSKGLKILAKRPVRCFAIRAEQRTEDPRQLAQSSGLALTTFARRPPTGQRSHDPLRHPLIT